MHKKYVSIRRVLKYLMLTAISFISVFPFFWMIISSTNETIDINRGSLLPGKFFATNLKNLMASENGFLQAMGNSAIIALISTILALLFSSLAGYGFEIFKSPVRERIFNILLLSMMVPFSALMIPLYRMFATLSGTPLRVIGLNTLGAVMIPTFSTAFLIFFFRQNTKSFPVDILEAARIDGLGELSIFFRMYVPVMKATYAAGAIITFMNSWNNYLWPLVALQTPDKRTLPLVISTLGSSYTPDYGMIMCAIVIATLPTALVFFVMQKHFVAGMIGSVK